MRASGNDNAGDSRHTQDLFEFAGSQWING
jgi:hypothetical protein